MWRAYTLRIINEFILRSKLKNTTSSFCGSEPFLRAPSRQIQAHNTAAKKKGKKKPYVNTKANTFQDRSSSALMVKISQPVSCNVPGTWYEVLLFLLPLVSSTATAARINFFFLMKMLLKKMVEYRNDPTVSCTVCQPLSWKSSTHQSGPCLLIEILHFCGLRSWCSFVSPEMCYVFLYSLRVDALSIYMFDVCSVLSTL